MAIFQDDGSVAAKAIQIAAQQAGKPYVWGAGGPDAFDCSGLVHYAYSLAGLPGAGAPTAHRWVTASISLMGDKVQYGQEQPGDLVMPTAGHVGIVIGNGQMWDAATTGVPVQVHKYGKPYTIRRLATPSNNSATGGTPGVTTAGNPIDALSSIGDAIKSFDNALKWLVQGHNWIRIGEVFSGAALLYLATKVD